MSFSARQRFIDAVAPPHHELNTAEALLALVNDPKASKAKLAELAKAVADAKDWAVKAEVARAAIATAERDLLALRKRHEDAHTAHEAKLEQGRRALEAEQKAIKAAKEAAEIDRREAKQLRAEVERRYAAFTA